MKLLNNINMFFKPDICCTRLQINFNDNLNKGDSINVNYDGNSEDYIVKKIKQNKHKMETTLWLITT